MKVFKGRVQCPVCGNKSGECEHGKIDVINSDQIIEQGNHFADVLNKAGERSGVLQCLGLLHLSVNALCDSGIGKEAIGGVIESFYAMREANGQPVPSNPTQCEWAMQSREDYEMEVKESGTSEQCEENQEDRSTGSDRRHSAQRAAGQQFTSEELTELTSQLFNKKQQRFH